MHMQFPELLQEIKDGLAAQRDAGVAINSVTARNLMLGIVRARQPELLKQNGGCITISRRYVRQFCREEMGWTVRYSQCTPTG